MHVLNDIMYYRYDANAIKLLCLVKTMFVRSVGQIRLFHLSVMSFGRVHLNQVGFSYYSMLTAIHET